MKVLSLGLDNSILDKTSALAARAMDYGNLIEKYIVIVPSIKKVNIVLSEKVNAHGSDGGNRLAQLIKIYNLAKALSREEGYDIITVQDQYYLAFIGLRLARKFKVGLEIQVHGFEKYYGLRKLIARYVLPRAEVIRCVSQRLKKQLVSQFGVPEEKIMVVPIFSEVRSKKFFGDAGSGAVREAGSEKIGRKFIFLTVGRLVLVKNIGLQIEAMVEVVKEYPGAELWIIGDGPERKNYELRITNYELEKNIKLLGWKDDLENYYNQADAFLLTSDAEGWGLAVIEAAGYGLPIIMTEVGCAGEVIKNGESGLVIPVGDRQKLVDSMLKLMADAVWREKLAESAKLAVYQLPDKEQTLVLYKKAWEKAMKNN